MTRQSKSAADVIVVSFACVCGARDEVREPCPREISCWSCPRTMARYEPRYRPPAGAGRVWPAEQRAQPGEIDRIAA
jgi:hypothetical protein